ncbi:MAG: hypothetical protein IPP77_11100 [Bacteroidetes bacterium]|nr:hypothetical protein [Bacteroidota bacterium]
MKYFLAVITALVLAFWAPSCTKDKTGIPPLPYNCDSISYSLNIKVILDVHCNQPQGSCHDITGAESAVIMDNYGDAKSGFETRGALCTIKQISGCLPMPDNEPKLEDSVINIIQCWVNNGYPE